MASNPNLKAALHRSRQRDVDGATYLEAASIAPDAVYVAGFDLAPATIAAIQSGYVDLAIDQQQWLQGFEAIAQLCLAQNYGFSGLFIDTGGGFVDASNIDCVAPLVTQQIR